MGRVCRVQEKGAIGLAVEIGTEIKMEAKKMRVEMKILIEMRT